MTFFLEYPTEGVRTRNTDSHTACRYESNEMAAQCLIEIFTGETKYADGNQNEECCSDGRGFWLFWGRFFFAGYADNRREKGTYQ